MKKTAPKRIKKVSNQGDINLDTIMRKSKRYFKQSYMEQVKRMDFNNNNFREYIKSGKKLVEFEDFNKMTKLEQAVYLDRMEEVNSGEWHDKRVTTFIDNYHTAIYEVYGDIELAKQFDEVYNSLDEVQKQLFLEELPDLYMFYKDKRANAKRDANITMSQENEQLDKILSLLEKYGNI